MQSGQSRRRLPRLLSRLVSEAAYQRTELAAPHRRTAPGPDGQPKRATGAFPALDWLKDERVQAVGYSANPAN
jgi:predicted RNA-binding Zn ribbon-like protein